MTASTRKQNISRELPASIFRAVLVILSYRWRKLLCNICNEQPINTESLSKDFYLKRQRHFKESLYTKHTFSTSIKSQRQLNKIYFFCIIIKLENYWKN
jgi:hypothetical protein